MVDVAKKSKDKGSVGGRKHALRRRDANGVAEAELVGVGAQPEGDDTDRVLLVPLVAGGEIVGREPLENGRERHAAARAELPLEAKKMSKGDPVLPTVHLPPRQ
jgi:nicotinate phosphoribosyltransferase